MKRIVDFLNDEQGQDLVEYALLLVMIALAALGTLPFLSAAINNVFSRAGSTLNTPLSGS